MAISEKPGMKDVSVDPKNRIDQLELPLKPVPK